MSIFDKKKRMGLLAVLLCLGLCACGNKQVTTDSNANQTEGESVQATASVETENATATVTDWSVFFKDMKLTKSYKSTLDTNPIMTQRFGADPYALVYGDRVYFYMTADEFELDTKGNIKDNSYSKIQSINVVSTDDFINFTDHGSIRVAGTNGAAKWAHNSWAPAAAWKNIDGVDKFFLYFADNGGGIGVLVADSPTGPFTDPLGHGLITRQTPNCNNVLWLFDPAVLVDDDGRAYLYCGGGVPEGKVSDPGTARVVELGEDMISLKGDPIAIDVPYLFEDSGIHKYGNKYYYTYCTNWQVDAEGTAKYGFTNAQIVSLESDSPMGPFTFKEVILENPGKYCGLYGNNHHAVFCFKDQWYITYHSRVLEKAMGVDKGYRATCIDAFTMGEDGTIGIIKQTTNGREQLKYVDPYVDNTAVNMAMNAGLDTVETSENGVSYMVVNGIDTGDYLKVQGVDFGTTAPAEFEVWVKTEAAVEEQVIRVSIDTVNGTKIAYAPVTQATGTATENGFVCCKVSLEAEVTGVHDLYLTFSGSDYEVKSWKFSGEGCKTEAVTAVEETATVKEAKAVSLTEVDETDCPFEVSIKHTGTEYGKVEHITYQSKTTGLERGANVLLPADYDPSKKYAVLYFQHGIFGDENSLIGDSKNRITEIVGNLVAEGRTREMIVVFPNMYAASDPNMKPGFNAESIAPYDNFINDLVNDLIPLIESKYSVSSAKEDRAILGFSMGGRETLFIGITRPDLFECVGAISPAPGLTPGQDWAMTHVGQLAESELKVTDTDNAPRFIMVCCGTKDSVVGKFPESYHNIMTTNGQEHLWYEVPNADHNDQAIKSGLYNFLIRWGV